MGLLVYQVMARNMYFGNSRASSIDLCVRDLTEASRFRANTRIFAEKVSDPFAGHALTTFSKAAYATTTSRANNVARMARQEHPDIIIVQQHLPTAAAIARRAPQAKVVLFRHNFVKSYSSAIFLRDRLHRIVTKRRYARLAGLIHVSQANADVFARDWPDITYPSCIVNNGLDFDVWHPAISRAQEVLCVGRCAPEKGILEAAQAVATTLPFFPGWRARFILSNLVDHPAYAQEVHGVLANLGTQAAVEEQRPFAEVKAANERAAIALVPSKWLEPFGRTALEAHAGGAALISSGTGGLAEVSGDAALILPAVTPHAIGSAIETFIADETLREKLAREGMARARANFDIRVQAARMDTFCSMVARGEVPCVGQTDSMAVESAQW